MLNRLSEFLTIFLFLGGLCFFGILGDEKEEDDKSSDDQSYNIDGMWYAVMTTGCTDEGPCNIFTNNVEPCRCIAAYFLPLNDVGWLVYMNALHKETGILTIDVGGASYEPSDSKKDIQGFILNRATAPMCVLSASDYSITEKVIGQPFFLRYKMSIIDYDLEYFYMITTTTALDSGNPLTVVWRRKKHPGRNSTWTAIVKNFVKLNIDSHCLSFISQDDCDYPTEHQYNEIFLC